MIKILIAFLISCGALAAPLDLKKLDIQSGLHFDYVDGEDISSRIFGYRFRVDAEKSLSEDVILFFSSSAILETGSNEVVADLTEFAPLETVVLNEGGVSYTPIELLNIKAGALSPREYNSPLLLTSSPVIGVQQTVDFDYIYFKALQAIPNNNRLARRVGTLDNGTPSFFMETLGLKYKENLSLEVSHYFYKDLAPNIALKSRQIGNSVTGTGEQARFNYGFSGYNVALRSKIRLGSYDYGLYGQYILNDEAPTDRNLGYLAGLLFGGEKYLLEIETFRNETDSAPGFYNSKYYGHNNISGQAVGLLAESSDLSYQIKYFNFKPLETNSIQFDTQILTFNLILKYEL